MPTEDAGSLAPATLITAREHLEEVVSNLKGMKRLAIDTESNGFYVYKEKVCLIQLSSPFEDFIIDPIAVDDLSCMAPLFADPDIEKVFHAGEYDVICLKRDYGFKFANLFDTMIAARLLGSKELGLAAAILRHFGLKLSKKLQRADWGKRPLTSAQLAYARMDTHFLLRLTDIQKAQLKARGRLENAQEAFKELCALKPLIKEYDPDGFWKFVGGRDMNGRQIAALKELHLFREREARKRDRAPFRVMPESILLGLSLKMPENMDGLKSSGMTPYLLKNYASGILAALKKAREGGPIPPDSRPRNRRDPREFKVFETLRMWRKSKAAELDIDPVAIVSSEELHAVARLSVKKDPEPLKGLSEFKITRYGSEILKILRR